MTQLTYGPYRFKRKDGSYPTWPFVVAWGPRGWLSELAYNLGWRSLARRIWFKRIEE